MRFHSRLLRALLLSALTWATVTASHAQSGEGPLRIVVGFPAGGSADTIARLLADKLRLDFQRPVLVDNRPGAGGRIAAMALKGLPRDGSVVMLAPDALVTTNPLVFRKPGYEVADLMPISLVAEFAFAFATGAETGAKSFPEYVAWARANRPRAHPTPPAATAPVHPTPARGCQSASPACPDRQAASLSAALGELPRTRRHPSWARFDLP